MGGSFGARDDRHRGGGVVPQGLGHRAAVRPDGGPANHRAPGRWASDGPSRPTPGNGPGSAAR